MIGRISARGGDHEAEVTDICSAVSYVRVQVYSSAMGHGGGGLCARLRVCGPPPTHVGGPCEENAPPHLLTVHSLRPCPCVALTLRW